jgi:hypothetical protein
VRILLEECVNAGVKAAFPGHAVRTVSEIGRQWTKDGPLLANAQGSFDVFVTIDRRLERQHDLRKLCMGVVARVPRNEIAAFRPVFAALLEAATRVKAGEIIHVESSTL